MSKSNLVKPEIDAHTCDILRIGDREARRSTGELWGPEGMERLEPRVMDLLFLLHERPGFVFSREAIFKRLWPDVVVGEDVLPRAVFKLRKALGDDAKTPRFIETVPKRGYRLIEQGPQRDPLVEKPLPPTPLWGKRLGFGIAAGVLLLLSGVWAFHGPRHPPAEVVQSTERANDAYFQYTYPDNETALELYRRVLRQYPDHGPAHSGMANALVQRVIRWPQGVPHGTYTRLGDALKAGTTRTHAAQDLLALAQVHARRGVDLIPRDAEAHKALGFVLSALGEFSGAMTSYRKALQIDPDAWGPWINLAELEDLSGRPGEALAALEAGFAAMSRRYSVEAVRMRPWYAPIAELIGDRHRSAGRRDVAERWYRKALDIEPLHPGRTERLAGLLEATGRPGEAADLRGHLKRTRPGP